MERNSANYCSTRTLRIIKCSYNNTDDFKVGQESEDKKNKMKLPKVKKMQAFKQLGLSRSIEQRLSNNGFNLLEMPIYLQENFGNMIELQNSLIKASKSEAFFKQMMISLYISRVVLVKKGMSQIIIVSSTPQTVKEVLQMFIDKSINIYIASEKNSYTSDTQEFLFNTPHILIGHPSRIIYNIEKGQLKPVWIQTLIVDDAMLYAQYNSSHQRNLSSLINFLPDTISKHFFYDPNTTPITPTLYSFVFN